MWGMGSMVVLCKTKGPELPMHVPFMRQVNFMAKEELDIWANYKVLQAAFVKLDIEKVGGFRYCITERAGFMHELFLMPSEH